MKLRMSSLQLLVAASLVIGDPGSTPDPMAKRYAFTIHPVASLTVVGMNASLEGPLGRNLWSYEVPVYIGYNDFSGFYENYTLLITGVGFGIRRYLLEGGEGSYIAPQVDLVNLHVTTESKSTGNALFVVPSLRWGYKARWDFFVLDAGVGFQFIKVFLIEGSSDEIGNDVTADAAILTPMFNFGLGIPF